MRIISLILFILLSGEVVFPAPKVHPMLGETTLRIFIGDRLFNDKVVIKRDKQGKYQGKLTVPKAFTADLEKIKLEKNTFSFEIEADEGRGKFRVRYKGEIHPSGKVYKGFATLPLKGDKILGGFVGQME